MSTTAEMPVPSGDSEHLSNNPLMRVSDLPLGYPPFDQIVDEHFGTAFDFGMIEQLDEVERIANSADEPTFDNTVAAFERSGGIFKRASSTFFNLTGADTNPERELIRTRYMPRFSAHRDRVYLHQALFGRIRWLYERREQLGLAREDYRLLERYYIEFGREGAILSDAGRAALCEMNLKVAAVAAEFSRRVFEGTKAAAVVVDLQADLKGLSPAMVDEAAAAARERGLHGKYLIVLGATSRQTILARLENRALRERIYKASRHRCDYGTAYDTTALVTEMLSLRATRAGMFGYVDHASFVLEDESPGSPKVVEQFLDRLIPPALERANRDAIELQAFADEYTATSGIPGHRLEAWDWLFYSERLRASRDDFDEAVLRPYLEVRNVLERGVFYAARLAYGLTFRKVEHLPTYHPDAWVYEVISEEGEPVAIFIADLFARPSKRGGAWMNAYVEQNRMSGARPVIAFHLDIQKADGESPTLLSWDEVVVVFRYALHGLLSNVTYPLFSGTALPRDFLRYPAQVNEIWADMPEVMQHYARHHATGEAMLPSLAEKLRVSRRHNQGFNAVEYLSSAVIDQEIHRLSPSDVPDPSQLAGFEERILKDRGIFHPLIPARFSTTFFIHLMAGYSAGYYAYYWAENVLASIAEWVEANGGINRTNGNLIRDKLLARGSSEDAIAVFKDLTGFTPSIDPLLRRLGLGR